MVCRILCHYQVQFKFAKGGVQNARKIVCVCPTSGRMRSYLV